MVGLDHLIEALLALSLLLNAFTRIYKQKRRMILLEAKIQYLFEKTGIVDEPISVLASTIDKALREGKQIEAIALYREATGCSLIQAKNAISNYVPRSQTSP